MASTSSFFKTSWNEFSDKVELGPIGIKFLFWPQHEATNWPPLIRRPKGQNPSLVEN